MKKEELVQMGLAEDMATKVAEAFVNELKSYIPKTRFDEVNTERNQLKTLITQRDSELQTLKSAQGDADSLRETISKLQAEHKAQAKAHAEELTALRVNSAVDTALTGARVKNLKAVRALLGLDGAELQEDGTVKGLAEQIEALRKSDGYLFETTTLTGARPMESPDEDTATPDTASMGYDELCAYLAKNPDAKL